MELDKILDNQLEENKQFFSTESTKKIIYAILILTIINIILSYLAPLPNYDVTHLDGTVASPSEIKRGGITTILIGVPLFSFAIALIISLIPFKKLSYKKKYSRFTLVTMVMLNLFILFGSFLKFF